MEDYEKLLQRALEKMPKKSEGSKRFKIPEIASEIQGQKTLIKNFSEIAGALRRDENHLAKYFSKEFAAPSNKQGGVLFLQKKATRDMLQRKLEAYIKEFVFCKICGEPDTHLEKIERIFQMKCDACGARSAVRTV